MKKILFVTSLLFSLNAFSNSIDKSEFNRISDLDSDDVFALFVEGNDFLTLDLENAAKTCGEENIAGVYYTASEDSAGNILIEAIYEKATSKAVVLSDFSEKPGDNYYLGSTVCK